MEGGKTSLPLLQPPRRSSPSRERPSSSSSGILPSPSRRATDDRYAPQVSQSRRSTSNRPTSNSSCDLPPLAAPEGLVACPSSDTGSPDEKRDSRALEDFLRRGFAVIEQLFKELDRDRCGAIPFPQLRAQLEGRGLLDPAKLTELWRSVIDKDQNNKADIAEFIVVLYMWGSRGLGSYRKLFRNNQQYAQVAKESMEALERYYRKYDQDSSGYLTKDEVDNFFYERLPKVSTKYVDSYFQAEQKLSFSQFLRLLYVSLGGVLDDFVSFHDRAAGRAPEQSKLWKDLVDLFATLELDYADLNGGNPVTLEDLMEPTTHVLERHPSAGAQNCEICVHAAAYRCPFEGCRLFICQNCYNSGVESHRSYYGSGFSGSDKQAVMAFVRNKFQRVDIDMSGALDFFEYTCFCFLCCEKMNYASLCKSSHNPSTVKKGLMVVSQKFKNYDRERNHALTWDALQPFCEESFGSIPLHARAVFSKLAGASQGIKLMGFFTFLYQLVMPKGQHVNNYCLPKPATVDKIITVLPDTHARNRLGTIPTVDMTKVHWGMQLGKGGQSMAYQVGYEGMTLVAKRPHPKTSTSALETMVKAAKLQMKFDHPNITRVLGVHEYKPVCILMELCEGGDVTALWSRCSSGQNPILKPLQWRLALELAEALNVLHTATPPVMHRDIKGSNVFLDRDRHVCLADFDLATEDPTSTDTCGTPGYMGPEVLSGLKYDFRCDIFAYAGFLYEVTHGCFPFSKETSFDEFHTKVKAMIEQGIRPQVASSVPDRMRHLIQACWQADPTVRPTMDLVIAQLNAMHRDFEF